MMYGMSRKAVVLYEVELATVVWILCILEYARTTS